MAAIGVCDDGLPLDLYMANLVPYNKEGKNYEVNPPTPFHDFHIVIDEFFGALEAEMGRAIARDVKDTRERAILVSVSTKNKRQQLDSLDELRELARTSGVEVLDTICQRPQKLNPKYLMGSGKIKELIITSLQKEGDDPDIRLRAYPDADKRDRRYNGAKGNRQDTTDTRHFRRARPLERRQGTGRTRTTQIPHAEAYRKGHGALSPYGRHRRQGAG